MKQQLQSPRNNSVVHIMIVIICMSVLSGCIRLRPPPPPPTQEARNEADKQLVNGVKLLRKGSFTDAFSVFEMAYEIVPSAEALDGCGAALWRQNRFDEAERYFRSAIAFNPQYASAYAHLARILELKGDVSGAEELHKEAIRMNPRDTNIRNDYAAYLAERGFKEEARAQLVKARAVEANRIIEDNLSRLR